MSSALDQFERSLVAASRALYASRENATMPSGAPASPIDAPSGPRDARFAGRRKRLIISFAALAVVASGVAEARSLIWPSQRLANGTVTCYVATHGTGEANFRTFGAAGTANGEPPSSYCRRWYRLNKYRLNGSRTGPLVAALPLVACKENATTVSVYVATGQPDQCRQLHERPLPTTYASAAARLRALQSALRALQAERDCVSPAVLGRQARAVLAQQGFQGWRVITPPPDPGRHWLYGYALPADTGGTCGKLLTNPPANAVNINTHRQTVTVTVGPSNTLSRELNHIEYELYTTTYQHCFTARSARTLVRRWFAHTPLRPRFATVAAQGGFLPASQRLYDKGCVRFNTAIPGNNNRFVDVLLNARHAPKLPADTFYPPAGAFHP